LGVPESSWSHPSTGRPSRCSSRAWTGLTTAVVDQGGRLVGSTRVPHSPAGLAELRAFLLGIAGDAAEIPCFVETDHGLLVSSLLEAGFPVYPVNPKTVDRHRKASGAKTDAIDAHLLARTGRSNLADLRRLEPNSPDQGGSSWRTNVDPSPIAGGASSRLVYLARVHPARAGVCPRPGFPWSN